MSNRKDLLADLAADPKITITTSAGRSYTARVHNPVIRDRESLPPIERIGLEVGRIELAQEAPAEADMRPASGGRAAV